MPGVAFNLYRIAPDQRREKLNVEPLGGKGDGPQRSVTNARAPNPRVSNEFQYNDTLDLARRPLSPTAQTVVNPAPIQRMESAQAFREMRDTVIQLRKQRPLRPAPPQAALRKQAMQADGLRDYVETISKRTIPSAANRRKLTEEDTTRAARSRLQLAAMLQPQIARDLGFTFDDKTAKAGVLYTYELRSIESGQECATAVVSIQFTVGKDGPVPSVTHLTAAQADENSVDLRWSRPANEDALVPTYKIKRVDSRRSHETSRPIMVADIPLDAPRKLLNGRMVTHVEPRSFYQDRNVAPGKVTYTVVMTDIFGRESAPASLDFTMEDWHTPQQVAKVWAELSGRDGRDVRVSWTPSSTRNVVYRVYRQDEEKRPDPELLTTTNPIVGSQISMPDELKAVLEPRRAAKSTTDPHPESSPASSPSWLAYTDKNVPSDHSYRYLVTAVYQNRNNLDSAASSSRVLPVPVTTLLAGPANLKFTLLPAPPARGNAAKWEIRAGLPRENNIGGGIQLTWDKVPGAKLYRVYRANASGYFNAAKLGLLSGQLALQNVVNQRPIQAPTTTLGARSRSQKATSGSAVTPAVTATPNIGANVGAVTANPNVGANVNAILSLRDIQFKGATLSYLNDISEVDGGNLPDSSYVLVGQVNDAGVFYDYYPRSQAHTYAYRVVAVNRWNVPAPGMVKDAKYSSAKVRVLATLPPSTPVLLSVTPDENGYLELKIQGNLQNQGVVHYHIYRRDLNLSVGPTPSVVAMPEFFGQVLAGSIAVARPVSNTILPPVSLGRAARISTLFRERTGYDKPVVFKPLPSQLASGAPLTYLDKSVRRLHEYFYYVVAYNGNESKPSNILNRIPPNVRADAPASLNASLGAANEVKLSWPTTASHAVYIVERAQGASTNFVQLSVASSTTHYTDYSAVPGRAYVYRVIAVEQTGVVSDPSAYPLDKPIKDPNAYPARVKFTPLATRKSR